MAINSGEEFRHGVSGDEELNRKKRYLAEQENDSVLTGLKSTKTASKGSDSGKSKRDADSFIEVAMMADPAYRELYESVGQTLDMADRASLKALDEALREEEAARAALEELQDRAARLPNGSRVYRTADGKAAYDENGNRLTAEQMSQVDWDDSQPTWEEQIEHRDRWNKANRDVEEIEDYRDDLADKRDRYDAGGLSPDELREMKEGAESNMPDSVRRHYEDEKAAAQASQDAKQDDTPSVPRTGTAASHILGDTTLTAAGNTARSAFAPAADPGLLSPDELEDVAQAPTVSPDAPGLG